MKVLIIFLSRTNDDFTCSLQQEHTLSQEELMAGVKKGILKGFLELDEKLRKIPEVCVAFCPQWPGLRSRGSGSTLDESEEILNDLFIRSNND